jgi:CcmD family protein
MGYLFAAYAVIWAVVFGYVFVLYLRQRKLLRDIELLKENLDKQKWD